MEDDVGLDLEEYACLMPFFLWFVLEALSLVKRDRRWPCYGNRAIEVS